MLKIIYHSSIWVCRMIILYSGVVGCFQFFMTINNALRTLVHNLPVLNNSIPWLIEKLYVLFRPSGLRLEHRHHPRGWFPSSLSMRWKDMLWCPSKLELLCVK